MGNIETFLIVCPIKNCDCRLEGATKEQVVELVKKHFKKQHIGYSINTFTAEQRIIQKETIYEP